ncbi:putative protein disulfide-isomerase ER-60 [Taenia crassiceps]|uniref:protein disulfide-isomerase n=1 Tax=Taenia crassiceps TaxID=6207 RepID=A0ABR4QKT8_9CEST
MQQAVAYLLKIRPHLSSLLASYNLTCHSIGTADDSSGLRHRWIQQRGALMTEVTTIQANFIVVIETQRKRTVPKTTLYQLCAYYLAFLDFALYSFQRAHRLLATFPDLPRRESKESRVLEMPHLASQTSSASLTVFCEKERSDLIADVTTIKWCRNTVKLLNNRLSSGHTAANRIPRLIPIVQATVSMYKASRERRGSTLSEWSTDTSHEYELVNFMISRSGPPAIEISDESQYRALLEGEDYTVLFQSKKSDEIDELIQLSLPKQLETKLEDRAKTYDGPLKSTDIEQWIRKNANRLISVAKDTKSRLQFALSDSSIFADELYEMGFTPNDGGAMVVILGENGKNYLMTEKFGVSELKKFVNGFAAGSLEPYVKSEPIPEKQEDSVMKVVGRTFDEIVFDKSKDVLVEFYAPWCGHCKALKPKYEELAKKLSKEKDVIIAAIDATANSFPSAFTVRGYPTIYWVPKASKNKPVAYEGGREVDDMLKFVAKSATDELVHYTRDGQPKQEEL